MGFMVSSLPMVPISGIQEPVIDLVLKTGFKQHNQQDTMNNQHVMCCLSHKKRTKLKPHKP